MMTRIGSDCRKATSLSSGPYLTNSSDLTSQPLVTMCVRSVAHEYTCLLTTANSWQSSCVTTHFTPERPPEKARARTTAESRQNVSERSISEDETEFAEKPR